MNDATAALTGWQTLAAECAAAAGALPADQIQIMAERAAEIGDPAVAGRIQDRPPTYNFRTAAARVVTAWKAATPPVPGAAVAAMLMAAVAATDRTRHEETVDLVWTGPGSRDIRAQATDDVLVTLIGEAQRSLILSTFASRRVDRLHTALTDASARGVDIILILENEESSNGQYRQAARDPFEGIPAQTLEWPLDQRTRNGAWTPSMHAKFVIVDDTTLFITSANLTGMALDRNIETGALIRGGPLPARLHAHLRNLAYDKTLQPIT